MDAVYAIGAPTIDDIARIREILRGVGIPEAEPLTRASQMPESARHRPQSVWERGESYRTAEERGESSRMAEERAQRERQPVEPEVPCTDMVP